MTKKSPLILALIVGGAIISGCGGGGGGGGPSTSGPVSPPVVPPAPVQPGLGANDCASKPQSLACTTGALVLSGPFALATLALNGTTNGAGAGAASSLATITQNAGSPGTSGDETYDWNFNLAGLSEAFPTGPQREGATLQLGISAQRYACNLGVQACPPYSLYLLYPSTSESGSLDYSLSFVSNNGSGRSTNYIYGVYGRETGAFSSAMLSGSAVYAGQTFGEILYPSQSVYTVKGRLWMSANFATGAITGAVTDFQGHYGHLENNTTLTTLPGKPDFDFAASLTSSTGRFSGNAASRSGGMGMTGSVFGSFFGLANTTPDEVGLSYLLQSGSGAYMVGAGVAGASPSAPAPPVAPGPNPPTTPTPTTPGCIQAACLATATTFSGPSTQVAVLNAHPGVASPIGSANIDNVLSGVSVTVDPGATSAASDDIYTVRYAAHGVNYTQAFTGAGASGPDGFGGQAKLVQGSQNGLDASFLVYDVSTVLSGALDFVQIAAYDRETSANGAEDAFIIFGRQTAPANMPTTGSAQYVGSTRGIYVTGDTGTLYTTASDITLSANFGTGAVSGQATSFKLMNSAGALVTRPEKLDFLYSGSIASGTSMFSGGALSAFPGSAGGLGLTGGVQGAFFGAAGQSPEEAGLVYQLGTPANGAFMSGGAALGRQP